MSEHVTRHSCARHWFYYYGKYLAGLSRRLFLSDGNKNPLFNETVNNAIVRMISAKYEHVKCSVARVET